MLTYYQSFYWKQVDKNWYEGERNAMVGLFPVTYVEVLSSPGDSNSQVLNGQDMNTNSFTLCPTPFRHLPVFTNPSHLHLADLYVYSSKNKSVYLCYFLLHRKAPKKGKLNGGFCIFSHQFWLIYLYLLPNTHFYHWGLFTPAKILYIKEYTHFVAISKKGWAYFQSGFVGIKYKFFSTYSFQFS